MSQKIIQMSKLLQQESIMRPDSYFIGAVQVHNTLKSNYLIRILFNDAISPTFAL